MLHLSFVLNFGVLLVLFLFVKLNADAQGIISSDEWNKRKVASFNLKEYHSFDQIKTYLEDLEVKFPEGVKIIQLNATTTEGRPLLVCKIAEDVRFGPRKPAIWIDAGIHAREWLSIATTLSFIDKLAHNESLTKDVDWYIMPVVNPDGYEYSRNKDRFWRKNRSNCKTYEDTCCGTDLNRNFDFAWSSSGTSSNMCENNYGGSSIASEPETKAIQDYVLSLNRWGQVKAFLTLHSFGQFWFVPYAHKRDLTEKELPKNYLEMVELAKKATQEISKYRMQGLSSTYKVRRAAKIFDPASGGSEDWAKSKAQIRYSYCIELPPKWVNPKLEYFDLPANFIVPVAESLWLGIKTIMKKIVQDEENEKRHMHYG